jgi:hypothetical protein
LEATAFARIDTRKCCAVFFERATHDRKKLPVRTGCAFVASRSVKPDKSIPALKYEAESHDRWQWFAVHVCAVWGRLPRIVAHFTVKMLYIRCSIRWWGNVARIVARDTQARQKSKVRYELSRYSPHRFPDLTRCGETTSVQRHNGSFA